MTKYFKNKRDLPKVEVEANDERPGECLWEGNLISHRLESH